LTYRGSHESYVYVFNEATLELGQLNTIFPLESQGLRNPLPAGKDLVLPHEKWVMNVDEAGGTERILLIVSKHPLPELASLHGEPTRGIHPQPVVDSHSMSASQLDRIVEKLGEPNWSLWWRVYKLDCEPSE
jgi:hypothetical protein